MGPAKSLRGDRGRGGVRGQEYEEEGDIRGGGKVVVVVGRGVMCLFSAAAVYAATSSVSVTHPLLSLLSLR